MIIFWPDDETWNDNADSTIRRNRYTFMRYVYLLRPYLSVRMIDWIIKVFVEDNRSDDWTVVGRTFEVTCMG